MAISSVCKMYIAHIVSMKNVCRAVSVKLSEKAVAAYSRIGRGGGNSPIPLIEIKRFGGLTHELQFKPTHINQRKHQNIKQMTHRA